MESLGTFLRSYGVLVFIGLILIFLFVWISRKRPERPALPDPEDKDGTHQHSGGCC